MEYGNRGPEDEWGSFSVTPTRDKGFILTGTTRSYGSGNADIFVVKLDVQGGLDWARAIGGTGQETGKTTLELNDGYMTVGDTSSGGAGDSDVLVVRYDFDGNIIWANAIGGSGKDQGAGLAKVADGFIVGGTIWSYGAGGADGAYILINGGGNVQWAKTVGGSGDEGIKGWRLCPGGRHYFLWCQQTGYCLYKDGVGFKHQMGAYGGRPPG